MKGSHEHIYTLYVMPDSNLVIVRCLDIGIAAPSFSNTLGMPKEVVLRRSWSEFNWDVIEKS